MKRHILYNVYCLLIIVIVGCKPKAEVPAQFAEIDEVASI